MPFPPTGRGHKPAPAQLNFLWDEVQTDTAKLQNPSAERKNLERHFRAHMGTSSPSVGPWGVRLVAGGVPLALGAFRPAVCLHTLLPSQARETPRRPPSGLQGGLRRTSEGQNTPEPPSSPPRIGAPCIPKAVVAPKALRRDLAVLRQVRDGVFDPSRPLAESTEAESLDRVIDRNARGVGPSTPGGTLTPPPWPFRWYVGRARSALSHDQKFPRITLFVSARLC